jgi:putative ABC transport system permease protein
MNTEVMAQEVKDFGQIQEMFMNLMMAFMGLGLIVGIAALGVIAARAVVERRQQIGMLRAIGFGQRMIQATFLIESSFVALLGILLGVALGVAIAIQIAPESGIEGMTAVIPWGQIVLIVALAYLASLLTTFLPAYRAARIYPAEALRYE